MHQKLPVNSANLTEVDQFGLLHFSLGRKVHFVHVVQLAVEAVDMETGDVVENSRRN